jgi:hypothetical protein
MLAPLPSLGSTPSAMAPTIGSPQAPLGEVPPKTKLITTQMLIMPTVDSDYGPDQ